MYLETIGNLMDYYQNYYLVHQCNCKSTSCLGLAKTIFKKYPEANSYITNRVRIPGKVEIIGPIINLYGQIYPGRARTNSNDSYDYRLNYFKQGLRDICLTLDSNTTINLAFPKYIGCGLAGGVWANYEKILMEFEGEYDRVNILVVDFNG